MTDAPVPDMQNYDMPTEQPIPDNFLDDTLSNALSNHKRKESQIKSVQDDMAKVLKNDSAAQNIASHLIGFIHTGDDPETQSKQTQIDPDEDDVRTGNDDEDKTNNKPEYSLDEMLLDTVTQHKYE